MQINFSAHFVKAYKKAPKNIQNKVKERSDLFTKNKYNRLLNNHKLSGKKYKNYHSINVTGDWRIIFEEIDDLIIFHFLGTHSKLYK